MEHGEWSKLHKMIIVFAVKGHTSKMNAAGLWKTSEKRDEP